MAITQYYVDPAIAANSGAGTIGDPYGDLQYALNSITRNSTDGDQINIKAGTAEVLAAALTLATYGTPTTAAPLILRGYTSAANDGGYGAINCNGATMWTVTTYDAIVLAELEIYNGGNNTLIALDDNCVLYRCKAHRGASTPSSKMLVSLDAYGIVVGCHIYNPGSVGIGVYVTGDGELIGWNYIDIGTDSDATGVVTANAEGTTIVSNIITGNHASMSGISIGGAGPQNVIGNICNNQAAGTNRGIWAGNSSGRYGGVVANNIVVGWSGTGGAGIESEDQIYVLGYNAFYNNTANYDLADQTFIDLTAGDVALGANPFTDAANGDFSLTDAAKTALRSLGWPAAYLGAHANTDPHITIGALQYGPAPTGSGGGPVFGGMVVR